VLKSNQTPSPHELRSSLGAWCEARLGRIRRQNVPTRGADVCVRLPQSKNHSERAVRRRCSRRSGPSRRRKFQKVSLCRRISWRFSAA
jgi:hypothetical protein